MLRLLTPLAALAAMASFAAREADPASAAESMYLAVLAVAALLPVGFLAPWPAYELGLGSTLAVTAVWALPPGPGRGAAVGMILLASLAVAAGRALIGRRSAVLIPLALGLQVLLRGDLLFAPELTVRTVVALVALPVAGALALGRLEQRHGMARALIAGGAAVSLAPGFNVASTLALIALAAGDALAREDLGRWAKALAWIALLAPIAWIPIPGEPGPGIAAAVCGLALWRPRIGLGIAAAVAAGLAWYSLGFIQAGMGIGLQILWLLLLVPAAIFPAPGRALAMFAAALMAATALALPDLSALAAPLALAGLSIRRNPAVVLPQAVWTGAVLGGTALLAGYPWMRPEPLASALWLLGLPPGPELAFGILLVFCLLALFGVWTGRGWDEPVRSLRLAGLTAACITLALLLGLPGAGIALLPPEVPVVLDAAHPSWEAPLPRRDVRSVVIESSLANGASLPAGTPVARVLLSAPGGRSAEWLLRAGTGTGEWAARRPDVARMGVPAPSPWISRVAGGFLAQRYRAAWTLARPERASVLRVERAPGVPADLAVAVYQVEVRR
ncbi:MAG: hypothetical protein ACJ75H_23990 [Thermoanaerobaculia bacterium]